MADFQTEYSGARLIRTSRGRAMVSVYIIRVSVKSLKAGKEEEVQEQ